MALLRVAKVLLWAKLVAKVFIAITCCFLVVTMSNYGVAKGCQGVAKVLLWAKLVAKVFIAITCCFLVVTMGNYGVAMALLRVAKALLRVAKALLRVKLVAKW